MKRGYLYSKASDTDEENDLKETLTLGGKKRSYLPVIVAYTFYAITYTIVIPALPGLALNLCNGNSSHSSYIYGMANFARYISEFFAAPLLGTATDIVGRKPMLLGSFIICGIEYAILAFFPSIPMLFATRIMAGLFDCSNPTVYTIITDLAFYNGDNVTTKFGLITALLGIGFVVGPLLGGILCDVSISLCFLISTVVTGIGAVITLFFLEETLPLVSMDRRTTSMVVTLAVPDAETATEELKKNQLHHQEFLDDLDQANVSQGQFRPPQSSTSSFPGPQTQPPASPMFSRNDTNMSALTSHSAQSAQQDPNEDYSPDHTESIRTVKRIQDITFADLNPLPALITHMKNPTMRDLTIPLFVSSLTVGSGSIWVIYQVHKYHSSSTEVGIYLAVYGVVSAVILGLLIKRLIPHYWNEQQAAVYGLFILAMQYTGYGLAPTYWSLFIVVAVFTVGMVSDPALKALIVKESLELPDGATVQGNLQGVLCSIRTLATAFGSLIFSALFAESLKMHPEATYISFLLAAFFFVVSAIYLSVIFYCKKKQTKVESNDDDGDDTINNSLIDKTTQEGAISSNQSLASGQDYRTSDSGWKSFFGGRNHSHNSLPHLRSPQVSRDHNNYHPINNSIAAGTRTPSLVSTIKQQAAGRGGVGEAAVTHRAHGSEFPAATCEEEELVSPIDLLVSPRTFSTDTSQHNQERQERIPSVSSVRSTSTTVSTAITSVHATSVLLSSGMMGGYPAPIQLYHNPQSDEYHDSHSRAASRTTSRC